MEYVSWKKKYPMKNTRTIDDDLIIILFTAGVLYFLSKSNNIIVDATVETLDIVIVDNCFIDNVLYCIKAVSIMCF
uniref:Uncharacterized protein n=1 Tax=viral metagenome TaxID=1070528 RepID=A0A6C0KIS5_9ZZZZ